MATNTIPLSRERLKAILDDTTGGGLTLAAARVKLGVVNQAATDEFFNNIVTAGPMCVIGPADIGDRNLQQQTFLFDIPAYLWIGYAADADYDYTAAEDLVSEILKKLANVSLYSTGAKPVNGIGIDRDDEVNLKPKVICYKFTLQYVGAD
jgi:hypothetical protein